MITKTTATKSPLKLVLLYSMTYEVVAINTPSSLMTPLQGVLLETEGVNLQNVTKYSIAQHSNLILVCLELLK